MLYVVLILAAIWNVAVLLLYAVDKQRAVKGKGRISERCLILCAFLFGSVGAWLGMSLFRHKTKKWKFRILVPLALLTNGLLLFFLRMACIYL